MPPPKTLKEAKASYKSRSAASNPLTEREQKQLERAAALERRAWGLREREKTRVDAVRKRGERERAEREERKTRARNGRTGAGDGGDGEDDGRRRDRHGFLASQMCLGAFFGRGGIADVREGGGEKAGRDGKKDAEMGGRMGEEEVGGDTEEEDLDDVDDDSLLQALKSPQLQRTAPKPSEPSAAVTATPPPIPRQPQAQQRPPPRPHPPRPPAPALDPQDFDFLDSSTQIARELSPPAQDLQLPVPPANKEGVCSTSFDSGSFDLTEEDLEELDPTSPTKAGEKQEVVDEKREGKGSMPSLRLVSGGRSGESSGEKVRRGMMLPLPVPAGEKSSVAPDDARSAGKKLAERESMPRPAHKNNTGLLPAEARKQAGRRTAMPPPALPVKNSRTAQAPARPVQGKAKERKSMLPPALPAVRNTPYRPPSAFRERVCIPTPAHRKNPTPAHPATRAYDPLKAASTVQKQGAVGQGKKTEQERRASFTLTELESFVEEDLVLTQAC